MLTKLLLRIAAVMIINAANPAFASTIVILPTPNDDAYAFRLAIGSKRNDERLQNEFKKVEDAFAALYRDNPQSFAVLDFDDEAYARPSVLASDISLTAVEIRSKKVVRLSDEAAVMIWHDGNSILVALYLAVDEEFVPLVNSSDETIGKRRAWERKKASLLTKSILKLKNEDIQPPLR